MERMRLSRRIKGCKNNEEMLSLLQSSGMMKNVKTEDLKDFLLSQINERGASRLNLERLLQSSSDSETETDSNRKAIDPFDDDEKEKKALKSALIRNRNALQTPKHRCFPKQVRFIVHCKTNCL